MDRVRKALVSHDCRPPPLTILAKDHKQLREDGSRPARPLCLAKKAPSIILGQLMSTILEKVADSYEDGQECISTEMLCRQIEDTNKAMVEAGVAPDDIAIGSLDAISLYPSLKLQETLDIITEMVQQANINFCDLDYQELGKYIRVMCSEEDIDKAGISSNLPHRYTNRGPRPIVKYLASDTVKTKSSKSSKVP